MKNVLLFADIGGHEHELYYHVGDEAMFYETYRWYKKNDFNWKTSAFTWFEQSKISAAFYRHLTWNKKPSWLYFLILTAKLFLYRITKISFFTKDEFSFIKTIEECNRIHFTGGGNLSSNFKRWLYYCFFVLLTARVFSKEIILTSQTIGPFTGIDKLFVPIFLNFPKLIGIRAQINKKDLFVNFKIFYPKVFSMLDAAYTQVKNTNFKSDKKNFIIGLSLHEWQGFTEETSELVTKIIENINSQYKIQIILIPHHLVPNHKGSDIIYMEKILQHVPIKIKTSWIKYTQKIFNHLMPANTIRTLTSRVDLLITTRYHGLVFSLSQNVPALALQFDSYYQNKNLGILEMIYGDSFDKYYVDVKKKNAANDAIQKLKNLIENNDVEKIKLKKINKLIHKKNNLNTIMNQLNKVY